MSPTANTITITCVLPDQTLNARIDQPVAILGRDAQCDMVFPAGIGVSRQHARLERTPSGWLIRDLASRNGTFVNGARTDEFQLSDGDVVQLGPVVLNVRIPPLSEEDLGTSIVFDDAAAANVVNSINMQDFEQMLEDRQAGDESDLASGESGAAPHTLDSATLAGDERWGGGEAAPSLSGSSLIRLFSQAGQSLLISEDLDEIARKILDLLFSRFPCERGLVCLYDEATEEMSVQATRTTRGIPGEEIRISQSVTRQVIQDRQSVLVEDARQDERFAQAASVVQMNICSAICAPLYHQGQVVGLIYLDTQHEDQRFTQVDLHILAAVAILSAVGVQQTQLHETIRREQKIRDRLSRYSSPGVVDRIVHATHGEGEMEAEEKDASILFADLSGFTAMSEKMKPTDVAFILNGIFERLTQVIFNCEGMVDKFIGDAIMAVFGAPLQQPDHAERAVRAALFMLQALDQFNREHVRDGLLAMRIGINSGSVVAGDIGSPERRDYTVIGDSVNVASRLESQVARPGQVVIGPRTHELVKDLVTCEALEPIQLKGKAERIQPYLVHEIAPPAAAQ